MFITIIIIIIIVIIRGLTYVFTRTHHTGSDTLKPVSPHC